jgi:hypothetical protein
MFYISGLKTNVEIRQGMLFLWFLVATPIDARMRLRISVKSGTARD